MLYTSTGFGSTASVGITLLVFGLVNSASQLSYRHLSLSVSAFCSFAFISSSHLVFTKHGERAFMGVSFPPFFFFFKASVSTVPVTEEELSDKCAAEAQALLNSAPVSGG